MQRNPSDFNEILSTQPTVDRRDFVKIITMAAASVGLSSATAVKLAEAASGGLKPSVIWLHFQECTGCTESLLRTSHPALSDLILDLISLDYHETLFAAAGNQAEAALHQAMEEHAGKYVCIVEGAIPTKDDGIYCKIAGKTAVDMLNEVADKAAAVIAIGSCASWGGIPSAAPNPTGAVGAPTVLEGKTVVTIPGCPANPYNLLGTVLQFVALGSLPALDDKGRPKFAYGRTIHEHCPRRAHFDAGRFVETVRRRGPSSRATACTRSAARVPRRTPTARASPSARCRAPGRSAIGHPCVGCTEQNIPVGVCRSTTRWTSSVPTPPDTYPPIRADQGSGERRGRRGRRAGRRCGTRRRLDGLEEAGVRRRGRRHGQGGLRCR